MSANTLTGLIPTLYEALDVVSRELVGFIPAVTRDSQAKRAAKGETISWGVAPAIAAADITPAATGPDPSGVTIAPKTMSISKSQSATFPWNGEEQKGANNAGIYGQILRDQFSQAMRALVNAVEADIAGLYPYVSRAIAVDDTSPFKTDLADAANLLKVLKDNGAPDGDLHMVFGTTAGAALRKQSILVKANEAGSSELLRRGILGNILGFNLHESGQIEQVGTAAAANYVSDGGNAVGDVAVPVKTGTAKITAGDIFTTAGISYKYVVNADQTGAGDLAINDPGIRAAITDGDAFTFNGVYTPTWAFSKNAIGLVTRAPAIPEGGDIAADRMTIQDPVSGLAFDVAVYRQYHQVSYEIGLAWGVKMVKSAHSAMLI